MGYEQRKRRGGDGNRTRVQGFADPCLNHSATPPERTRVVGGATRCSLLQLRRFGRRRIRMPLDPSAPAVALTGVWRAFGDVVAVNDLAFEVPRGTVTVLLGPNGAGKTTVVRLVTGALHPDAGAVRTLGLDPNLADEGREARRRCGVVPARPALYDRLTGSDNLRYAAALFEVDPRQTDATDRRGRGSLRDRRRARPTRRRLLDRHAGAARARACGAARPRPPAARRADRRARPRVGADGARAHRRDGRRRQDRAHVHAPAARGRGPRRPGDRDGPRPRDRRRLARGAQPPILARGAGDPRRRRPEPCSTLARDLPFVRAYERNGTVTVDLDQETDVPDLVDALVRRRRSPQARASRARRASRSSTSPSGSRNA